MSEQLQTRPRPLVLVVDDELSARLIMRATLEEAGFEVAVGTFCDRALTPRNLMVLAERRAG